MKSKRFKDIYRISGELLICCVAGGVISFLLWAIGYIASPETGIYYLFPAILIGMLWIGVIGYPWKNKIKALSLRVVYANMLCYFPMILGLLASSILKGKFSTSFIFIYVVVVIIVYVISIIKILIIDKISSGDFVGIVETSNYILGVLIVVFSGSGTELIELVLVMVPLICTMVTGKVLDKDKKPKVIGSLTERIVMDVGLAIVACVTGLFFVQTTKTVGFFVQPTKYECPVEEAVQRHNINVDTLVDQVIKSLTNEKGQ